MTTILIDLLKRRPIGSMGEGWAISNIENDSYINIRVKIPKDEFDNIENIRVQFERAKSITEKFGDFLNQTAIDVGLRNRLKHHLQCLLDEANIQL